MDSLRIRAGGIKVEGARPDATSYSPFLQNGNFIALRKVCPYNTVHATVGMKNGTGSNQIMDVER
jgi:hypothetical protein